jgi:phage terminase large subunit
MQPDWNPDYQTEFQRRLDLIRNLEPCIVKNAEKIEIDINAERRGKALQYYKYNPIDWINDWCITYDPRRKDLKILPFILFPRQCEFIQFLYGCLSDKENGLVEKCRDMGATWLCCCFAAWLWIFHDGTAIGFGSRKEEYVDEKGNPKAIFPKIRMILEYLPDWMLPENYDAFKHAPYMKIINVTNDATITGEAGDNIGRGGRTTMYLKDESAHYERPELVEAALGDNTDVQIDISSVNGSANVFYRRRMAGEEWQPNKKIARGITRVFIMDWRDHPLKTQEWYDMRYYRAERESLLHVFRQEVDRDYSGSIDRIIIQQEWINAAIDAHLKLKISPIGLKMAGQDVADGGRDKNALVMRHGIILKHAEDWGGDAGEAAKKAVTDCSMLGVSELYYESPGVGSGFKSIINNLKEINKLPHQLKVYPWDPGAEVLNPDSNIILFDSQSPTNKDFYYNRKAQAWWSLRTRFYKTFRAIMYKEKYDPEELISLDSKLPNLHRLRMELSQAQYKYSGDSRVLVDKKPEGAMSPNLADATVICYFPSKELSILDVI